MDKENVIASDDLALLDHIAELTQGGNEMFSDVRAIYESNEQLRPPADWGES